MEQNNLNKLIQYLEDAIRELRYAENSILFAIMAVADDGQLVRSILYQHAQGLEETRCGIMSLIAQQQHAASEAAKVTELASVETTPFD